MKLMKLERQQAIMDYLKQNHAASVAELSRLFFISETSIRRDLDKLERSGLLRKTYGGAILLEGGNEVISLDARQQTEREAKANIARKAADCIENGDVIFLDSSSTVLAMAAHLKRFTQLSVATNGLRMACELAELPGIKVFSLGGWWRRIPIPPMVRSPCALWATCARISSFSRPRRWMIAYTVRTRRKPRCGVP